MVQSTVKKFCPFCGGIYASESFLGTKSPGEFVRYGSPMITCKKCNRTFYDRDYREIAIYGVKEKDLRKVSPRTIVYSLLLLVLSLYIVFSGIREYDVLTIIWGCAMLAGVAYIFFSELLGYKKRMKKLEQERIESEKRMANLSYAVLLRNNGYPVPDRFLKKSKSPDPSERMFETCKVEINN